MTKAEQSHLNRVANIGCIVCRIHLNVFSPCHIHHIRHGMGMGQRNSNYNVIGLCPPHHQTGGHGVAFHAGKEAFEENFGTELELQERLNELLAVGVL